MSLALLDLPFHVLENIVDVLKKDAVLLGCTNTYFNSIVKERIYKSIIIENKIKQNLNSIWNVSFKNYVTVFVDDIELFSNNLRLETIPYIKHVLIASQTDGTENVYLPLYNALNQSDSRIQIDNLDISNVRNFQSMTQSRLSLRAAQVAYEGDDEMCVNVDSGKLSLNPRKGLVNWNIYDIRELSDIAFDESVEEINIFIEEHTSKNHTQNQYQNLLQNGDTITENLRSIYLNLPASTLSFISLRSNAPLLIENLSVTTSHSFKNFGFKSINTKISFLQLNQSIDLSNLKSLELKINCDFHNRCEDQCIIQFFRDWESFVRTNQVNIQLEKLVLINFKSNTSDGNLNQFINLMNYHFPFAIFQNLKEFYLQIDDFSNMKPKKNHSQNQNQIDSFNLQILLHNLTKLPALTKLTIPDFFNLWFTNVEFNPQNSNYFDQMVNKCDCADCNHGRALYNRYAKYDSLNGYKHKFENIEIATTKGNDSKIDIELPCNFRFLNYVVNTLRDRLSFSHKNIFTINSILKMDDIEYSVTTENSIFKEIVDVIIHLCLQERFKELSKDTGIKQVNLGGIVLKDI